uniref:hypothetical protein n=2 Tax=Anaerofustis TaxID=264995 RepID=UPI00148500C3
TTNYINESIFKNKFNDTTIDLLEDVTFDDSKGYFELVIDDKNDLKIIIYPSSNYKEIEKIEISYNWINTESDNEYETLIKKYSGYTNMIQTAIWRQNNNPKTVSTNLWDKLNSIEYKYTKEGIPYGEVSYEDDKIIYKMKDTKDGTEILTMTPNNK